MTQNNQQELFAKVRAITALQAKIDATYAALSELRTNKSALIDQIGSLNGGVYACGDYKVFEDENGDVCCEPTDQFIRVPEQEENNG